MITPTSSAKKYAAWNSESAAVCGPKLSPTWRFSFKEQPCTKCTVHANDHTDKQCNKNTLRRDCNYNMFWTCHFEAVHGIPGRWIPSCSPPSPRRILWNTFGVGSKGSLKNKFSTREQLRNLNLFPGARLSAHFLLYKSSPQSLKHVYLSTANML